MRSSEQLSRTPLEWHEHSARLRGAILTDLLAILAKSHAEHWYRWVVGGRPVLSRDEYEHERIMRPRAKR